jgi:D-alanyl-D-alanine carboxypeptidase
MFRSLAATAVAFALTLVSITDASETEAKNEAVAPQNGPILHIFQEWLSAFNSGNVAEIKVFYRKYLDDDNPIFALENAQDTCGFSVERFEASAATAMTVLLRQRCLRGLQRAKLELAADGKKLKTLDFRPLALPRDGAIKATALIANRLAARDDFAGSIIVARGSKRVFAQSWGLTNVTSRTPMSLDTPMFLASAGKMFTAVAVLQLVDAGKIDLDAPFGKYLTAYPNAEMAEVTIRQLLNHRGGTGDIGILGRDDGANRAWVKTIADIVQLNGNRGPDFPPGTKEDYSNYGFILLGAVIEKVTGGSYYDYVADHVFKPAGMKDSGFPDKDHLQKVAVGYTTYFGAEPKLVANTESLPWRGTSAGGGVSTPNDMLKFMQAMRNGKLLSPKMFKLATTADATPWYGMGFVVNSGQNASWGHGGNSYGMDVAVHYYVKNDTDFVCLGTRDMVCNRLIFAWFLRTFPPSQ